MQRPRKLLYLASPLFSRAEKAENVAIASALENWCDVFLPQRDGELVPRLIERGESPQQAYRIVFGRDVSALDACDAIVINLDGRAVDEGAAFELGYAYALKKICIGYRTDPRSLLPWGNNPMIVAPLLHIFETVDALEEWAKAFSNEAEDSNSLIASWR